MIPSPAQYLLRFDDLCPTMRQKQWNRFLPVFEELAIRPILAVVPDNQDDELQQAPPDPQFWEQMRAMQAAGATVALHGFRHLCASLGKSLVPLHDHSEFAGQPETTQRQWIHAGLMMLRNEGLNPKVFVAPRHGFDKGTLRALRAEGIRLISDGLARLPFRRGGVTWIPQQLWGPMEKSKGLWTICIHTNTARTAQVDELVEFLRSHAAQFTSVDRVLSEMMPSRLTGSERIYERIALLRIRAARVRRRMFHKSRKANAA